MSCVCLVNPSITFTAVVNKILKNVVTNASFLHYHKTDKDFGGVFIQPTEWSLVAHGIGGKIWLPYWEVGVSGTPWYGFPHLVARLGALPSINRIY